MPNRLVSVVVFVAWVACVGCRRVPSQDAERRAITRWSVTCEEAERIVGQIAYLSASLSRRPLPIRLHRSRAGEPTADWVEVDGCRDSKDRLRFVNEGELSMLPEGQLGYVLGLEEYSDGSFAVVIVRKVIRPAPGRGPLSENSSEMIPVRIRSEHWSVHN